AVGFLVFALAGWTTGPAPVPWAVVRFASTADDGSPAWVEAPRAAPPRLPSTWRTLHIAAVVAAGVCAFASIIALGLWIAPFGDLLVAHTGVPVKVHLDGVDVTDGAADVRFSDVQAHKVTLRKGIEHQLELIAPDGAVAHYTLSAE